MADNWKTPTQAEIFSNPNEKQAKAFLDHVHEKATKGDAASVIAALDDFGYTKGFHMSVGDVKGKIVDNVVLTHKPRTIVEIGGFIGYSAIRFALNLRAAAAAGKKPETEYHVYSFEIDPVYERTARAMIEFAGVQGLVTVIHGDFHDIAKTKLQPGSVDMFFIDHWKQFYVRDFKVIEQERFCHTDSVVVADNVIYPGAPEYLEYVATAPSVKSHQLIKSELEYSKGTIEDGVSISIMA